MADAEPRKRSRFDQKEPDSKRASRFDRRSRSPPTRSSETRERSPLEQSDSAAAAAATADPAAAAAAAAAKINAQLQARKGVQHVDVPPILGSATDNAPETAASATPSDSKNASGAPGAPGEMYMSDGDYIQDIEVNDLRNRYMLMKAQTQQSIQRETGADLTTRGKYYPNKSMATAAEPPLYLHITARTKEALEAAVGKVNELIEQELPQLVDERRFKRREREQPETDDQGRRKWPEESIPVSLEPIPGFNLRAQIVGAGGSYVKHIQQETGCRVQIKGRGSGYIERDTNMESEGDMFLHVAGPDPAMVEKAKDLCHDLIANVSEQYEEFKNRPPRQHSDRGGYGDRGYGGDRGGYGRERNFDRGGEYYNGRGNGDSYSGYGRYNSDGGSRSAAPPVPMAQPTLIIMRNTPNTLPRQAMAKIHMRPMADMQSKSFFFDFRHPSINALPLRKPADSDSYVAMYQQYYAQYQQGQTAGAQSPTPATASAPGASASPPPPPPPPPGDAAPPPPPASAAPPPPPSEAPPGTGGSYNAVPPPPGL